jgi:hypothetical protein
MCSDIVFIITDFSGAAVTEHAPENLYIITVRDLFRYERELGSK